MLNESETHAVDAIHFEQHPNKVRTDECSVQAISSRQQLSRALAAYGQRRAARSFATGLGAIDALLPAGSLSCGAIHEVLSDRARWMPLTFAMMLARAAVKQQKQRVIVWCDSNCALYPPAL